MFKKKEKTGQQSTTFIFKEKYFLHRRLYSAKLPIKCKGKIHSSSILQSQNFSCKTL